MISTPLFAPYSAILIKGIQMQYIAAATPMIGTDTRIILYPRRRIDPHRGGNRAVPRVIKRTNGSRSRPTRGDLFPPNVDTAYTNPKETRYKPQNTVAFINKSRYVGGSPDGTTKIVTMKGKSPPSMIATP